MSKQLWRMVRMPLHVAAALERYRDQLEAGRDFGRRAPARSGSPDEGPTPLWRVVRWLLAQVDDHRDRARKQRAKRLINRGLIAASKAKLSGEIE